MSSNNEIDDRIHNAVMRAVANALASAGVDCRYGEEPAVALHKAAENVKRQIIKAGPVPPADHPVPSADKARINSLQWEKGRLNEKLEEAERVNRRLVARNAELSTAIDERSADVRRLEREALRLVAEAERQRAVAKDRLGLMIETQDELRGVRGQLEVEAEAQRKLRESNEQLRQQLAAERKQHIADADKLRVALNSYLHGCFCCRKPEAFADYDAYRLRYGLRYDRK